ncbi:MAG: sensor histidine kinase [Flammeovirgaceae bacterium]
MAIRLLFPDLAAEDIFIFVSIALIYAILLWEFIAWLHVKLEAYYPFSKGPGKRFVLQLGLGLVFILPTMIIFWEFILPFIDKLNVGRIFEDPMLKLIAYGSFTIMMIAINAAYFGLYFFEKWKEGLVEKERLAKEKALMQKDWSQIQFTNLQNQLNPHFFFNSITSLNSLIHENQELASRFLKQLSKVYRYILQHRDQNLVSLETEWEFVQNYISLLKTRFEDAIQIDADIQEEDWQKQLVPVTLQVLIENSIKHNQMSEEQPLQLKVSTAEGYLSVSNTLQLKRQIEYSNGIGLENMKLLFSYLTDLPVLIEKNATNFIVKIPLISA